MNIKNAEAAAIAGELAEQTGMSMTQVVLEALRARKRELDQARKVEEIMELCRDTASRMKNKISSLDIGDLLYDEYGLPK